MVYKLLVTLERERERERKSRIIKLASAPIFKVLQTSIPAAWAALIF
jgi:hypothetical protein